MDIAWDDVRLFLAVAETGSLSAAARRLQVGQPTVSRRLAELEERVGGALFRRDVQGASLTPLGEQMLEPARRMAEWAGELERAVEKGEGAGPRGVVRITAAPGVAYDLLAPFAAWLRRAQPGVRLEVLASVQYLDLVRREADLALRTRPPEQRDLVVVAELLHDNAAFAAPSYAARLPEGYGLAELDWIAWAPPFDRVTPNVELAAAIPGFRPAFASDDYLVQIRACEAGVGAMFFGKVQHRFSMERKLVPLELELGPHARSTLYLVAAKSALEIGRVRLVAELLAEELRAAGSGAEV